MKTIIANNDKKAYAIVDDDVYEIIQDIGLKFYIRKDGYFQSTSHMIQLPGMTEKKKLYLHQFVWILKTKTEPSLSIDHQDRNKANNQFLNLRLATIKQQNHNRGKLKSNTSGYTGIYYEHANKKNKNGGNHYWKAHIYKPDGKDERKYFDYDDDGLLEAIKWRDQKAKQYYGEFAVLNFPDENK